MINCSRITLLDDCLLQTADRLRQLFFIYAVVGRCSYLSRLIMIDAGVCFAPRYVAPHVLEGKQTCMPHHESSIGG